jgi:hypothetical protein
MRGGHVIFGFGDTLEKQLALLGDGDQLEFFRAITVYRLHSEDTRFEEWKSAIWEGMKDAIDNFGGSERGAPRGNRNAAKDKGESKQFGELNSIQNNSKTNETNQKQFGELNSIQNNSPNDNVNENDNEKEKKEEKETSEETNRETDKVQEDTPFFLDSKFSEKEEGREEAPETGVEAQVAAGGSPRFTANRHSTRRCPLHAQTRACLTRLKADPRKRETSRRGSRSCAFTGTRFSLNSRIRKRRRTFHTANERT